VASSFFSHKLFSLAAGATLAAGLLLIAQDATRAQERGEPRQGAAQNEGQRGNAPNPAATLPADVARLKDLVPPMSHPMADVSLNASLLWFAGQKKNWPLANYFLGETRNRMNWEVKLNPAPKGPTGEIVDMKGTVDGINNGSLAEIKKAIDGKDVAAFETAYKHMLEDCYSCHKATNRAYMRPMIPTAPPQTIINFDPTATWPQ
jgi:hypothetical protein